MTVLALDLGGRRTGAALYRPDVGFVMPLDTLVHDQPEDAAEDIDALARERGADRLVVGLPLLPSGKEGAQTEIVRACVGALTEKGWDVAVLDERYSTPRSPAGDGDAEAACEILKTFLRRQGIDI